MALAWDWYTFHHHIRLPRYLQVIHHDHRNDLRGERAWDVPHEVAPRASAPRHDDLKLRVLRRGDCKPRARAGAKRAADYKPAARQSANRGGCAEQQRLGSDEDSRKRSRE